jgi:hypothetical protein
MSKGATLTLAQKLAAFDSALHGGEIMATRPIGNEASSGLACQKCESTPT